MKVSDVFPKGTVTDIVKNFDFTQIDVGDSKKQDFCFTGLAPSFGRINMNEIADYIFTVAGMKNFLITNREDKLLEKLAQHADWDLVMRSFAEQDWVIEPLEITTRASTFSRDNSDLFNVDPPSQTPVNEIRKWLETLVSDEDVCNAIPLDMISTNLQNIITETGNYQHANTRKEHTKRILDVTVIQYPDTTRLYFKVYRIKLDAWFVCDKGTSTESKQSGIRGEFMCRQYNPRKRVIECLHDRVWDPAFEGGREFYKDIASMS